ncbi:CHASE domain-containing protein, partial [Photobacterium sanguinicancri]
MSQTLLSTYNNVDALLLLPNGVVTLVYPYEEHKRAIGHNILQDKNRKQGANQSIVCKKSIIIGPVKLVQNGKQAFILRKSISNHDGFIGFSASVIYLESILNTLEKTLKSENVNNYSIIGYDPDNGSYYDKVISSKGAVNCNPHKDIINIFNTNWQISISPDDTGIQYRLLSFSVLLVVLFLIISPI